MSDKKDLSINEALFEFIKEGPTAFHTVAAIQNRLNQNGFTKLCEDEAWDLYGGGSFYVCRNSSSILAFKIGNNPDRFRIAASHSDAPGFKIKPKGEIQFKDKYIRINSEGYGGMIAYSWLDRPLSIAGRVICKDRDESGRECLSERLFDIDRDLCIIPSLAIHMNRKVNTGVELNLQTDMLPLLTQTTAVDDELNNLIGASLGINAEDIYGRDAYLYNRAPGSVWGANEEFISAPMLDDLQCAYSSLIGFLESQNDNSISVYACFDNEEVGSGTLQGAASSFLQDTLERICICMGYSREEQLKMYSKSFMLSEDNGHAVHPNHPEKTDSENCVYMNGGIVIKSNASQKYTTDGIGAAICRKICEQENIPYQFFANRSDEAGGSTLGNIASCRVPIKTVDIGLAQLAMHSAYETAGARDTEYMKRFTQSFMNMST